MANGEPWSDAEVAELRSLLAAGHSRGECARIMGRPLGGVRGTMLRHGLTSTARGGDPATLARRANSDRECLFVHSDSYSEPYVSYGRMDDAKRNSETRFASIAPGGDVAQVEQHGGSNQWVGNPRRDPAMHATHAADGYHLRGVSTLLNAEGVPVMQWVKDSKDPERSRIDAIWDAVKALPETWRSVHKPVPVPRDLDSDLLCIYSIADAHVGMFSWAEETGNDYDVTIAERLHVNAIRALVDRAPPADECIIANLGDLVHCDSNNARTARAGNPLDTDTRLHKVARVATSVLHAAVTACLAKHRRVRVIMCAGNHDPIATSWLSVSLEHLYGDDERVTVDGAADVYHWHRFGQCFFGFTHGTARKPEDLPLFMARERPEDWGQTKYHRWLTGHVHHRRLIETPGCKVETFGTLAPSDAWAHGEGYMSERDMRVSVYHRTLGERGQLVANASEVEA